jgi:hypothetical protein
MLPRAPSILSRWKNYFSQLLNGHNVSDVRQIEIPTTEALVHDPSSFVVEITIEKSESCNSLSGIESPE